MSMAERPVIFGHPTDVFAEMIHLSATTSNETEHTHSVCYSPKLEIASAQPCLLMADIVEKLHLEAGMVFDAKQ